MQRFLLGTTHVLRCAIAARVLTVWGQGLETPPPHHHRRHCHRLKVQALEL